MTTNHSYLSAVAPLNRSNGDSAKNEPSTVAIYDSFEAMEPHVPPSIYQSALERAGLATPPQFPEIPVEGVYARHLLLERVRAPLAQRPGTFALPVCIFEPSEL